VKRGVWITSALAVLTGPTGWILTDRLESSNGFCTSCHLEPEVPLHEEKMGRFTGSPAADLASRHRVSDDGFLCVDCHAGASWPNRARVKAVAARDALMYMLGRFEEPASMQHPLWDEDCSRCHAQYKVRRSDDYHAFFAHNLPNFEFRCVSCHRAHPSDGSPEFGFLERDLVLGICRKCHEEY
jgi:hypothetical protein